MSTKYVKIAEARKHYGVSDQTLRKWLDSGKIKGYTNTFGTRYFNLEPQTSNKFFEEKESKPYNIFYCRVSTSKQKDDLKRQVQFAREQYPEHYIIQDVGSGLNWKRKGLISLLDRIKTGRVESVTVFHRDRLCRFGFDLFQQFFELLGVKLLVHEQDEHQSSEQELAEDLMSIVHIYSCRNMAKRRYGAKPKDILREEEEKLFPECEQEGPNKETEVLEVQD
jgi:predicted site-specific integrase-resolvase